MSHHLFDAPHRLDGADQDSAAGPPSFRNGIHAVLGMDGIHVQRTGTFKHRGVASSDAAMTVARWIIR